MAKKIINYNVDGSRDDSNDYRKKIVGKTVNTKTIKDLCGHEKITVGCDGTDCGNNSCGTGNSEDCCVTPIILHGDVEIRENNCEGSGTLTSKKIIADSFVGDGRRVKNVDDTKIVKFKYDKERDEIKLVQLNYNDPDESVEVFKIDTQPFTKDTKIVNFDYDQDNSDVIALRDNNNNTWKIDLSKYNDKPTETYISSGSCDNLGNINLKYNQESMRDLNIDISDAIKNLEKHITEGYINDKNLILKVKNSEPIVIPLYELIYDLKFQEDKYIQGVEWCGHELSLKRNDGVEFNVSFHEIISDIVLSNIDRITGGCINQNNEIILSFEDGRDMVIGRITDNDTYIVDHVWIQNPQQPNNPHQTTLRLRQNNDTHIDIRFTDLISKLRNDNTYLISGEIFRDKIILKNNDGTEIEIPGLINSDTFIINGFYNKSTNQIKLNNNKNRTIDIDVTTLIEQCQSINDKHLKEVKWSGDTLIFNVDGHGELYASFQKYKNIDRSIKDMELENGTLTITDLTGKESSVSGFVKQSDIKNIREVFSRTTTEANFLVFKFDDNSTLTVKIPDAIVNGGEYSFNNAHDSGKITLNLSNGNNVVIDKIQNTYVTETSFTNDTLKLTRNDGTTLLTKLTPLTKLITDNNKIIEGQYVNGQVLLKTQKDVDAGLNGLVISGLPLHTNKVSSTHTPDGLWSGVVNTLKTSDYITVNIDIENNANHDAGAMIVQLPINLPFTITKTLFGEVDNISNDLKPTVIEITETGIVRFKNNIPYSLNDSFTIAIGD